MEKPRTITKGGRELEMVAHRRPHPPDLPFNSRISRYVAHNRKIVTGTGQAQKSSEQSIEIRALACTVSNRLRTIQGQDSMLCGGCGIGQSPVLLKFLQQSARIVLALLNIRLIKRIDSNYRPSC